MLPSNASHHVGVGGFVINDKNEVLVVQEKIYTLTLVGLWKIPTSFILKAEEIYTGVVREIKETGIDTEFVEVIAFREYTEKEAMMKKQIHVQEAYKAAALVEVTKLSLKNIKIQFE